MSHTQIVVNELILKSSNISKWWYLTRFKMSRSGIRIIC